jgi:hypothetical protein
MTEFGVAIYVDRIQRLWVVRDREGHFWTLPQTENAWEHRRPFEITSETSLESVPGHYRYLLRLPF